MWQAIKVDKKPFVAEVKNRRKNGAEYWQELHISPVLSENGEVKLYIGIEPNISERKEREKFRDEFISILTHQLKNPLTSVKWTLEWIRKQGSLTLEQQEAVGTISKQNESLLNLISDLLVFAKIGTAQHGYETIDLAEEINAIIDDVKKKNPRVTFSFEREHPVPIATNKSLALQVFANLIANAAEYSDRTAGNVRVTLQDEGTRYIFSVENNGTSIPAKEQQKIFSKFFRASNAAEAKNTGTGLGLFVVKLVCDNFKWQVWFESPLPGQDCGTVFFVAIPSAAT